MNFNKFFAICMSIVIFLGFAGSSMAGQVVTDDIRQWAVQAINNEKSLETVPSANTLAVLYFKNISGREDIAPLQKGFALMLITDLSIVKDLQVVERAKLQALVEELGLGTSGLVEEGSAPRVGRLLGARSLVGGDIASGKPEGISVQSRLLDVQKKAVIGQPISAGLLDDLFQIEKNILFDIVKLLKIEVSPETVAKLRRPCSTKNDALMALFTGVDASDQKNYEKAAESYRKALKLDSNICVAGEALTELQNLGLISNKKSGDLLRSLRDTTSLTNQLSPKDEIRHIPTPGETPTNTGINVRFPGTQGSPTRR